MQEAGGRARFWAPAVVIVVAAVIRCWGLTTPDQLYWDEQYYVFDAEAYLGGGFGQPLLPAPTVKIADEGTWVHPPLGKWLIALLGVGPVGARPLGWRLPSVVFGVAGVALLYLLALHLWGSIWWATMAASLLSLDGLHIVQSRIAMLDIFMSTFVIAGVLLVVLDHKRQLSVERSSHTGPIAAVFGSWYRLASGSALGAAVACKWAAIPALVVAALFCLIWSLNADRGSARLWIFATVGMSFVVAPLVVYLMSYGAFFFQHGAAAQDFATLQRRMLEYHQSHSKAQPESSRAWTWPLMLHPSVYLTRVDGTSVQRVVALGNPVVWWVFLVTIPPAMVRWIRRPTWPVGLIFAMYAALFLPWLFISRSEFIFYMLPAVPFMCLGVTAALRDLPRETGRRLAVGIIVLATVTFVAFFPWWSGTWVPATRVTYLDLLPEWPS